MNNYLDCCGLGLAVESDVSHLFSAGLGLETGSGLDLAAGGAGLTAARAGLDLAAARAGLALAAAAGLAAAGAGLALALELIAGEAGAGEERETAGLARSRVFSGWEVVGGLVAGLCLAAGSASCFTPDVEGAFCC